MGILDKDKEIEIRDCRDNFLVLDNEYLNGHAHKCGIYATGVYLELCRHANKSQQCWPSITHIAEKLAISKRQVIRALIILEQNNIISKETNQGLVTKYTLLNKKFWGSDCQSPVNIGHGSSDCQSQGVVTGSHPNNTNITKLNNKTNLNTVDSEKTAINNTKEFILLFANIYKQAFNQDYAVSWGRDGKLIKLLTGAGVTKETFIDRLDVFFSAEHEFKGNCDIPSFYRAFNRLRRQNNGQSKSAGVIEQWAKERTGDDIGQEFSNWLTNNNNTLPKLKAIEAKCRNLEDDVE